MVLGMHRSGTSAFARVASLLGCDLPVNLMAASEGNSIGHWESNDVVTLNDELLAAAGSSWDDWLPMGDLAQRLPSAASFLDRAVQVLEKEYGSSPFFVLKDPRICRITPFWLEALRRLDISPVIALPLRNPFEVAASLEARDGSRPGHGLLLWLRHVIDAESASRGLPRYAFSYEKLLYDWRHITRRFASTTGIKWPQQVTSHSSLIDQFLKDSARHQRYPHEAALGGGNSEWIRRAYVVLSRWAEEGGEAVDYDELDDIAAEFAAAGPTLATLTMSGIERGIGVGEAERERTRLSAEVKRLTDELARRDAALPSSQPAANADVAQTQNPLDSAETDKLRNKPLRDMKNLAADASASVEAPNFPVEQQVLNDHQAQTPTGAGNGNATNFDGEAQFAQTSALQGQIQALEAHLADLSGALHAKEQEITRISADLSSALLLQEQQAAANHLETGNLREQVASLQSQVTEFLGELREHEQEAAQAKADLTVERRVREQVDIATQVEIASLRERAVTLQAQVTELTSALLQRKEEATQAWAALSVEQHAHRLLKDELERRDAGEALLQQRIAELNQLLQNRMEGLLASEGKALQARWETKEAAWRAEKAEEAAAQFSEDLEKLRADHAEATSRVTRQEKEVAQLVQFQMELERRLLSQAATAAEALAALETANTHTAPRPEADNSRSFEEIAQITRIAAEESARARDMQVRAEWLRNINALNERLPRLWALLPKRMRKQKLRSMVEREGLFDFSAYYAKHSDVAQSGMDALDHYVRHGIFEGRSW
jgi:hypothetical protein